MIKPGDWVYVTDEVCVNHTGDADCCDLDFSDPVQVNSVQDRDTGYPIEVIIGQHRNGTPETCLFKRCHIMTEEEKERG